MSRPASVAIATVSLVNFPSPPVGPSLRTSRTVWDDFQDAAQACLRSADTWIVANDLGGGRWVENDDTAGVRRLQYFPDRLKVNAWRDPFLSIVLEPEPLRRLPD